MEERDGKYFCKKHGATRPDYCRTYPANFRGNDPDVIEGGSRMCPIIKEVVGKQREG